MLNKFYVDAIYRDLRPAVISKPVNPSYNKAIAEETKLAIVKAVQGGATQLAAARIYGVSIQSVSRIVTAKNNKADD